MSLRHLTALGTYFFIGSAFAAVHFEKRIGRSRSWELAALGLLAVLALGVASQSQSVTTVQVALWLGLPCATFALAHLGRETLRSHPHTDLSYGTYIYAFPIQQAMTELALSRGWSFAMCLGSSLVITLVLAALSWHVIEKPCIRWTRRALSRYQAG